MAIDWAKEKGTHSQRVLKFLWDLEWHAHNEIDEAISLGKGTRYGGRIGDLRDRGWMILSRPIDGDKVNGSEYRLVSRTPGPPWIPRVKTYLREQDVAALLEGAPLSRQAREALEDSLSSFRRGASAKKADKARRAREAWFRETSRRDLSREELAYLRGCRDPIPAWWGADDTPTAEEADEDDPLEFDLLAMIHGDEEDDD